MPRRHPFVNWLSLAAATVLLVGLSLVPRTASAQADDPCLSLLSEAELERYDALAEKFFRVIEAENYEAQLSTLDEIEALCDANLRVDVFRADALAGMGRCEDAVTGYFRVIDAAPDWPHPDNAEDARARATDAVERLRDQCVAEITVECSPDTAQVRVGQRTPRSCGQEIAVASGDRTVSVSAPGMRAVSRSYDFRPGANFVEFEPLEPLQNPGTIDVNCAESGVQIELGDRVATCPASLSVESGQVELVARRGDGSTWRRTVMVDPGKTAHVSVPAASGSDGGTNAAGPPGQAGEGTLIVACDPPDAKVTLTGSALGQPRVLQCPVSTTVPAGNYQLTAEAPDREPVSREVSVGAGDVAREEVSLESASGGFTILVRAMGGAAVFLGDETTSTGESKLSSTTLGSVRASVMIPFATASQVLEIGAMFRLGVGAEDNLGTLGTVALSYLYNLGFLALGFHGGLGYGTVGADLAAGLEEDAGLVYHVGMLSSIPLGSMFELSILLDLVVPSGGDFSGPVIDIMGGIGMRF